MRNWNQKLFLGDMPGRTIPVEQWIAGLEENEINTVFCLVSDEEIAEVSPEYADWRSSLESNKYGRSTPMGERRISVVDIPVDDFGAPSGYAAHNFWEAAFRAALRILEDKPVFVHCRAGIGRTGMFAVAVLMTLGYEFEQALEAITDTGSRPEAQEQIDFLSRGIPAPIMESEPPKDMPERMSRLFHGPNDNA